MRKMPELLAPAGDLERLKAAVVFGADAVYLAGKFFGMRASAGNFTPEELDEGVRFAHRQEARVYLALNTLPRNDEISALPDYLSQVGESGVDALIVSDMGVLSLVKEFLPDIEIHMSTQTGIVNYAAANALYKMGAKRIVLARELSLEEIAEIRAKTPPELEIEAFVHGAMCVSFSGRCLLSNYMSGRDSNRGECVQPCRWKYHLMEEQRPGQFFPVFEDEDGAYILNAKDLCMIEHVSELVKSGVSSFKIEGRAKSEYYVSVVTNAYRLALDAYLSGAAFEPWLAGEVAKVSHRQYGTGFYFGRPEDGQCREAGGYVRHYDVVAVVTSCEGGRVYCSQRNKFYAGDELEVLPPRSKPFLIRPERLFNPDGEEIENTARAKMVFFFEYEGEIPERSVLRKKIR
ncbi:MAG: U32 family peptidase [Oscillospiraceae bacterium]|jgi:putative protease|nr:U32 family peptidase [Oscillospiraceae bacterium]